MKIAIVTPVFPPYGGGMGVVAYHHARILAAAGHAVTVVTPVAGEQPRREAEFTVHAVPPLLRWGNAAVLLRWPDGLKDIDAVHLHYPFIGGVHPVLAQTAPAVKLIVHYHMDLVAPGWRGAMFVAYQRITLPRVIQRADRVIVVTRDYAETSALSPWLNRWPKKFVAIPNGVDAKRFTPGPRPEALARRLGVASRRVVLLVGGLDAAHYFKGVDVLIAALAMLPADVSGVIVGSGSGLARLQRVAKRRGVSERIIFAGFVPAEELPAHYRLADVVVLPSVTRSEAFGIALLEGMACARATVASDLPGVRTVVEDGVTGFLARPGDARDVADKLGAVLRDPARAAALGATGRQRVETFYDWPVVGRALNALYGELRR